MPAVPPTLTTSCGTSASARPKAGLTFALDGFDILGQLSSLSQYLNSQGRTESYRNTLHSYVMAHVLYRLNKKPKK